MATMVLLAQREESHLVRAAFPIVPMISDYLFGDAESMTLEERQTKESVSIKQSNASFFKYFLSFETGDADYVEIHRQGHQGPVV